MSTFTKRRGFTLIELLLVIGIIAILAAIVIVAINPTKQLAEARNAQRNSDVTTILNAVYQYAIDNNGNLPSGIPTGASNSLEICQTDAADCTGLLDLEVLTGSYVVSIPVDPQEQDANQTNYWVYRSSNGRVTVTASGTEIVGSTTEDISVTR